ncbi:MAG: hypothetical protein ACXVYY_14780 [Oryzihumus sp.]
MDRRAYLLHQVHPAKLATDCAADAVSTWLMWRGRPRTALFVAHLLAAVASTAVSRRDLSALGATRRGAYVLHHMPPSAQAVRYLGQLVAWQAAYRHRPWGVALGHVVVAAGWSHGLVARALPSSGRGAVAGSP